MLSPVWTIPPLNIHLCDLLSLPLQTSLFPFFHTLLFPDPKTQRNWGVGSTHIAYHTCMYDAHLQRHFTVFCRFVLLYVIYCRFAGEKRVPQKKVLSWKKQRMRESRCQSRSTNSPNLEISTTTCVGPLPPGSGTRQSRCVPFYSETHHLS